MKLHTSYENRELYADIVFDVSRELERRNQGKRRNRKFDVVVKLAREGGYRSLEARFDKAVQSWEALTPRQKALYESREEAVRSFLLS